LEVLGWGMGLIDAGSKGMAVEAAGPAAAVGCGRRRQAGGRVGRLDGAGSGGNWWRQTGWGRGGGGEGEERAVQAMPAMWELAAGREHPCRFGQREENEGEGKGKGKGERGQCSPAGRRGVGGWKESMADGGRKKMDPFFFREDNGEAEAGGRTRVDKARGRGLGLGFGGFRLGDGINRCWV
jgi:hypothetical protein